MRSGVLPLDVSITLLPLMPSSRRRCHYMLIRLLFFFEMLPRRCRVTLLRVSDIMILCCRHISL